MSLWAAIKSEQIPWFCRYNSWWHQILSEICSDYRGKRLILLIFGIKLIKLCLKTSFKLRKKPNLCVLLLSKMLVILSNVIRGYQIISLRNSSIKNIKVLERGNFTSDRCSQKWKNGKKLSKFCHFEIYEYLWHRNWPVWCWLLIDCSRHERTDGLKLAFIGFLSEPKS